MTMINKKFYSWYNTQNTDSMGYVDLCVHDINESAQALDELKRVKKVSSYDRDVEAWWDYHKPVLLENILYLLKRFGLTLDHLKSKNEEEDIV